jgi:ferritin
MISENIQAALNRQAADEASASSTYLSMALWCDAQGLPGAAAYLNKSSEEEREHMTKFLQYIVDQNGSPRVPAVPEPPREFDSLHEILNSVLELEMKVANGIHKIVDQAWTEKDYATFDWLRFFVEEQRDAEIKARNLIDQANVIGKTGTALYEVDKLLGKLARASGE